MTERQQAETRELLAFIEQSQTAIQAVESISKRLTDAGYIPLCEGEDWKPEPGHGYFVTRNQTSIIAFRIPRSGADSFMIAASHTDSPMFKLKSEYHSDAFHQYLRLNTEVYGGTVLSTWMDRPLSLAGRVIVRTDGGFCSKSVSPDRDLVLIPGVAIHMNRTVNSGYSYNPAVDMQPLFSQTGMGENTLKSILAKEAGCDEEAIAGMDLYVYNRTKGSVWGANGEFFSAPRIDNLMCAYGTLQGFLRADPLDGVLSVYYAADNEETGSATKQGAGSVFLSDVLGRISEALGKDKRRMLASSMMVSADNGHARHPNHPELSDGQNAPDLNGGVVIKTNAAQKYATDGMSESLFTQICKEAGVPVQHFANRSDMPGGSTLGSISNTLVPLVTVDIGMAQLAMHSAYETAGCADPAYLADAMKAFYNSKITAIQDGDYRLETRKA